MIPFYEWFNRIILTSSNSVPIQSLWTAFFNNPVDLNRALQAGLYENGVSYFTMIPGAGINTAQSVNGALFANSITIPGEGMNVSKTGPEGMGPIKGNISSGRKDLENLTISFLDTNMSFCDYNIRPWIVYANHKSLKDDSIKGSITIIQWAKSGKDLPLKPRAIWNFWGAVPVSISSEEWNYGDDKVVNRQVEFVYNYYTLNAEPLISTAQAINSIIDSSTKYSSQPVTVPKGSVEGYGKAKLKSSGLDVTQSNRHPEGQPVVIPEDDIVSRGVNIGLEILNGNSNVRIASTDAVNQLRLQGEELLQTVKIAENDTPEHTKGTNQSGFVYKEPVGDKLGQPDHVVNRETERDLSGIPLGGNAKQNAKDISDTPLFFPGDGDEDQRKIAGRTVSGELDTPEIETIPHQAVEVDPTGDVGKNIPLQIVVVKKDDAGAGGNRPTQHKVINSDDVTTRHPKSRQIIIAGDDVISDSNIKGQQVVINQDDARR